MARTITSVPRHFASQAPRHDGLVQAGRQPAQPPRLTGRGADQQQRTPTLDPGDDALRDVVGRQASTDHHLRVSCGPAIGAERVAIDVRGDERRTDESDVHAARPDFGAQALDAAILSYRQRERRFGRTSEQLQEELGKDAAADGSSAASALG